MEAASFFALSCLMVAHLLCPDALLGPTKKERDCDCVHRGQIYGEGFAERRCRRERVKLGANDMM